MPIRYHDGCPLPCYCCGKILLTENPIFSKLVDLDPGDPENGPDPDICEVEICHECNEKGNKP